MAVLDDFADFNQTKRNGNYLVKSNALALAKVNMRAERISSAKRAVNTQMDDWEQKRQMN